MLFNSIDYLFFFIACYIIYWILPSRFRKYILIIFSLIFYGYWSGSFLIHFVFFIFLTHLCVLGILKTKNRIFLILGVGINLINLCFFKYFLTYIKYLTLEGELTIPFFQSLSEIILPLAISFYTFQMIAYVVDAWRGKFTESPFLNFLLFILFFPQLIAGPIMRHDDFYDQIDHSKLSLDFVQRGILHILSGLVKKVLIADQLAKIINPVYMNPGEYDGISILLSTVAFSFQVYGDFSGYTDLARGSAFLLGYEIPENFRSPFLSVSFSELWSRWHYTLSTWIRDYLYIPLGGNRVSEIRYNINTIIVMSLSGLWHGNTYTFFLWGFFHGIFLSTERIIFGKPDRKSMSFIKQVFAAIWVFFIFCILATFFRIDTLKKIGTFWAASINLTGKIIYRPDFWGLILASYAIQILEFKNYFSDRLKPYTNWIIFILSFFVYLALIRIEAPVETFIYFQF
ncbi:MBOAT family protein [Leptospira congkakensis]|uniref:MBOAT family protein n=1 Tax=Leptospira congkakensis TaxID=2484932 RepID=A0A4Z1A454_9LEPT|nr:MBOAT family O-acyltransferase [Leptospira congkakensis]TGL84837.1 MBOAT family protein [Leptospira congkakensis]TGL92081.1 MBOAT family protein [Leptospira congkakensis]TGL96639.1 MBOAT family protein [Leptospira congkakensis]